MVLVWSGIGITAGAGKLGGTILSRHRSISTARVMCYPRNPQSPAQQDQRIIFSQMATRWQGISDGNRLTWLDAAASDAYRGKAKLGVEYQPSGFQAFMVANLNILIVGGTAIANAPVLDVYPTIDFVQCSYSAVGGMLDVDADNIGSLGTNDRLVYYASGATSAGKVKADSFRFMGSTTLITDYNFGTAYLNAYGLPPDGSLIHTRAEVINSVTGQRWKVKTIIDPLIYN